jgi:type II secretion system protein I
MVQMRAATRGFTLIEVLVALTIMAFAVVYLVQLSSSNLRLISTSGDYMDALVRAESKMREILSRDKLEEKSWREETDQGYQVDVSISETLKERSENLPMKLLQIEMTFSWQKALRKKTLTLKTLKMVNKIDNKATGD